MLRRLLELRALHLGLLGALAACSATADSRFSKGSGQSSGAGGTTSSGTFDVAASSSTGDAGGFSPSGGVGSSTGTGVVPGECSEASKYVYVVGTGNELFSFSPPTLTFKQIGSINCVAAGGFGTPFSMAVARDGTAYVLFD
ncbi:MAG: hypothetical protein FJ096_17965, partial [Deltaproteobacteria bacterium]|nr:hypothetical protein [Deltaproteobacteria bacterium]